MIDTLYRKDSSFLHRFDCRLKLLLLPFLVLYFFLPLPLFLPGSLLVLLVFVSGSSLGLRDVLLPVKMIFPLLLLILILTPLFYRQGEPLWMIGDIIVVTDRGLSETGLYIFRFAGITTAFFLLFRTTPMEDILLGLAWYRLPYILTLVISVALRYIPHLAGLYSQITAAHALRCGIGDAPRKKGPVSRVRHFFPILVSLMIQSVKTIPVLTMALELKGVGRDNPRSRLRMLSVPSRPVGQILLSLTMLVLLTATLLLWL